MQAFISYLKSIHIQKDKAVFDLSQLPIEAYAASLGLPGAPQIRFITEATSGGGGQQKKAKNQVRGDQGQAKEVNAAGEVEVPTVLEKVVLVDEEESSEESSEEESEKEDSGDENEEGAGEEDEEEEILDPATSKTPAMEEDEDKVSGNFHLHPRHNLLIITFLYVSKARQNSRRPH